MLVAAFPSREVLNTFDQRWFFEQSLLQPEILKQGPSRREKSASNPSTASRILQGPTANDVAEKSRRIGDLAVYKYYLAANLMETLLDCCGCSNCIHGLPKISSYAAHFSCFDPQFAYSLSSVLVDLVRRWSSGIPCTFLYHLCRFCCRGCIIFRSNAMVGALLISTTHLTKFQEPLQ
jgi:hypothetical protein